MLNNWLKIKEDKLQQLQVDRGVAMDKINVLKRVRKDFPNSDDVRFSLQDAISDLNNIDKQIMIIDSSV